MVKNYSIYTGCLIPSRYPSIEISARKILKDLGVKLHELHETTCCPNQMAIKSTDEHLWEIMAARNLALAEKAGYDILTLCNGCYNTLKTVNSALINDDKLRDDINQELSKHELEFKGTLRVKHILEVLHDDISTTSIEKLMVRNLEDLRAAVHYGCHIMRPEDNMGFDDPEHPVKLDKMVELLGAKSIEYPEKYQCCGGGLKIASTEDAVSFARTKLMHIKESGADCIVVVCPYCRAQFESALVELQESYNEEYNIPIFYYTELLALAFGYDPSEVGLNFPDVSYEAREQLLARILAKRPDNELFDETITKDQLKICLECLACADDCPAATVTDYHPEELLELAVEGKLNELLARDDIWRCMNCHECIERCPQGFGMVKLIFKLKNMAIERGICPDVIANRDTELAGSGFAFAPDNKARKKLGLPPLKSADPKKLTKLISGTNIEKATKECED
ncbi:MAG: 4Fe-4S dicluster domain-containing protein [Thermoplasmata archaeon]|nr:4Fe-4S dicluster domain-containing protein [Thermoplasmata archaeon]